MVGLDWIGLGWVGLDWVGLGWIGLGWLGYADVDRDGDGEGDRWVNILNVKLFPHLDWDSFNTSTPHCGAFDMSKIAGEVLLDLAVAGGVASGCLVVGGFGLGLVLTVVVVVGNAVVVVIPMMVRRKI